MRKAVWVYNGTLIGYICFLPVVFFGIWNVLVVVAWILALAAAFCLVVGGLIACDMRFRHPWQWEDERQIPTLRRAWWWARNWHLGHLFGGPCIMCRARQLAEEEEEEDAFSLRCGCNGCRW